MRCIFLAFDSCQVTATTLKGQSRVLKVELFFTAFTGNSRNGLFSRVDVPQ